MVMKNPDKNTWIKLVKGFFPYFATPAMIAFLIWYSTKKEADQEARDNAQDELMFENQRQKVKIIEFSESDYNPIAVYEEGKKVTKSLKLIDTIFKQNIKNDSIKKLREVKIEISRASRDSSQKAQAKAMKRMDSVNIIQTKTMQKILQKLDSIK